MPEKKITKAIVCPMCGEMSKADVYTSINPSVTKGVRRRALDGELFAWKCPSCGYSARLTYPILYNDMKNRFMVYFIPKIDHFQLCDNELEEKYSNLRNISKRIVPTFNSFKEKIFIFESGLDDMSVELTKLAISQTVSKKLNGAEIHDMIPALMDACPKDGPTMSSCTIWAGAGILPDFNTLAKSFACSGVKCPVICELPPVIS